MEGRGSDHDMYDWEGDRQIPTLVLVRIVRRYPGLFLPSVGIGGVVLLA
jgi:hypothetical protein